VRENRLTRRLSTGTTSRYRVLCTIRRVETWLMAIRTVSSERRPPDRLSMALSIHRDEDNLMDRFAKSKRRFKDLIISNITDFHRSLTVCVTVHRLRLQGRLMRGGSMAMYVKTSRINVRHDFFCNRVVNVWNRLPASDSRFKKFKSFKSFLAAQTLTALSY